MLTFFVKYPERGDDFLRILNEYIVRIIDDSMFYDMSIYQVVDSLGELSAYATMFVGNEEYSDRYKKICRKISDIHEHYPVGEMNWVEEEKGYEEE